MSSPLVDRDGFPLPHLDLAAVRAARSHIHRLTNDRHQLDAKLKTLLERALTRDQMLKAPSTATSTTTPTATPSDAPSSARSHTICTDARQNAAGPSPSPVSAAEEMRDPASPGTSARPIAVRSVLPASPAAAAGLAAGDVLTAFGTLHPLTSAHFSQLPNYVRDGVAVPVGVMRQVPDGRKLHLTLTLTPSSSWGGRGLLGYVPLLIQVPFGPCVSGGHNSS